VIGVATFNIAINIEKSIDSTLKKH